jgi:hypothetical protein
MISHLGLGEIEARLIAAGSNIGPETARVGEELREAIALAYPQSPLAAREAFATRMMRVALARIGAARASGAPNDGGGDTPPRWRQTPF